MSGFLYVIGSIIKRDPSLPIIEFNDIDYNTPLPKGYNRGIRVLNLNDMKVYDITERSACSSIFKEEGKFVNISHYGSYDFEEQYNDILARLLNYKLPDIEYTDYIANTDDYLVMFKTKNEDQAILVNMLGEIIVANMSELEELSHSLNITGYSRFTKLYSFSFRVPILEDLSILERAKSVNKLNTSLRDIITVIADAEINSVGLLSKIDVSRVINGVLKIPEGVTVIGDGYNNILGKYSYTINDTRHINKVIIPKSCVKINDGAFKYTGVETVTFHPESKLKEIGKVAFLGNSKLVIENFPKTIERLDECCIEYLNSYNTPLFTGNTNLKHVQLGLTYNGELKYPEIFYKDANIKEKCFYHININSLEFMGGVRLEDRAIAECIINKVILSGDLSSNCSPFYHSVIDDLVINANEQNIKVPEMIFSNCTINNVTIIGGHKVYFGDRVFYKSKMGDFDNYQIQYNVAYLGNYCFEHSTIYTISITRDLEKMGKGVFANSYIKKMVYTRPNIPDYTFKNALIDELDITNSKVGFGRIGDSAFEGTQGNNALYKINRLHAGIIGKRAFYSCSMLDTEVQLIDTSIIMGEAFENTAISVLKAKSRISLEEKALNGMTNLTKIDISECVRLGKQSIYSLANLEEVKIGLNIKELGSGNFKYCSKIMRLYIIYKSDQEDYEKRNKLVKHLVLNSRHSSLKEGIISFEKEENDDNS